jgi:hypothetical protein
MPTHTSFNHRGTRSLLADHHITISEAYIRFPPKYWREISLCGHRTFISWIVIGFLFKNAGHFQEIAPLLQNYYTLHKQKSSVSVHRPIFLSCVEEPSCGCSSLPFPSPLFTSHCIVTTRTYPSTVDFVESRPPHRYVYISTVLLYGKRRNKLK